MTARFNPKITDTLKDPALPFVGTCLEVFEGWLVESGPYEGQMCWITGFTSPARLIGWIPDEDLDFEGCA